MFYGTDDGNKLVDESNYPPSIKEYLEKEKQILIKNINRHDVIIEVGCMEARNMEYAINNGKKYVGIDIVEDYIRIANRIVKERHLSKICEFLCVDAEKLDNILQESKLVKGSSSPLFFFPFNSFGNMNNYNNVLDSIMKIKNADFLIFSYDTDKKSTQERYKYYSNCNYDNLSIQSDDDGVRFTANNGLNSIAYNKEYLIENIVNRKLPIQIEKFSDIGIVYSINTREKEFER